MNDLLGLSPTKALLLLLLCGLIGGLAGLLAILSCQYMLSFGGRDAKDKHGISVVESTRIGGVLIVMYLLLNLAFQTAALGIGVLNETTFVLLMGALPFFLIGLYEDLYGVLSARFRFLFMLATAALLLVTVPMLSLQPVGVELIDSVFLSHPVVALIFAVVCLAFLPNAFNTADGANGLVSGVSLLTILALAQIAPNELQSFLYSAAFGCLLFLIYNLATGRFFLGDGGAYFLGALIGLCLIVVSNTTDISVWYLLALIFYPVGDLLVSMTRRLAAGKSPFTPDNAHLHNLIFTYLNGSRVRAMQANTLTGLIVATLFCAMPIMVYQMGGASGHAGAWFFVYAGMWMLYGALWFWLNRKLCLLPEP